MTTYEPSGFLVARDSMEEVSVEVNARIVGEEEAVTGNSWARVKSTQ
jgi:hypothetical protein